MKMTCVVWYERNIYRAATIVLKENNCHLLRVDKEHFNRILRDVEANTLRLQEHGKGNMNVVYVVTKIFTKKKLIILSQKQFYE